MSQHNQSKEQNGTTGVNHSEDPNKTKDQEAPKGE